MKPGMLFLAGGLGGAAALAAVDPPEPAEAKIRLLSSALQARDEGDFATARSHLESLLGMVPGDEDVTRLLVDLDLKDAAGPRSANETRSGVQWAGDAPGPLPASRRLHPSFPAESAAPGTSGPVAGQATSEPGPDRLAAGAAAPPVSATAGGASEPAGSGAIPRPTEQRRGSIRDRTGSELLREVDAAWRVPGPVGTVPEATPLPPAELSPLWAKLERITVPGVSFNGLPLARVVNTLSAASAECDTAGPAPAGVNIVLVDPAGVAPGVSLTLRHLSLRRVLDFLAATTGFRYEVEADAVVFRPADGPAVLETAILPVSRAAVLRMTGRVAAGAAAEPGGAPGGGDGPSVEAEGRAIRGFLQSAGVDFAATPGSSLAFDGSQLFVSQTARNLERVRGILGRYARVRQVEIEAKFMEVQEGVLEELGVQWNVATKETQRNAGARAVYATGRGGNRSLNEAFSFSSNGRSLDITAPGTTTLVNNADGSQSAVASPGINLSLPTAPPLIPGGVALGAPNATLANITGIVGEFDVNALVRALAQRSGTELLSAPRLTVLSGNPATITVAQELRYPQSYGEIQSQVGTGSVSGGGSAGVSITSGTPQEFTTRNVGVELRVTATVEEDDRSISLDLNPKVTEFEGFMEFGGPSVAISGGTTVTVPPGFYQPIFAVREVATRVTIWDGATLVMGGLTREDVKKVKDKVPVLGSLPLVGRLFRSEGESSQKRNLLIFVTARLVDPGGGLSRRGEEAPAARRAVDEADHRRASAQPGRD